MWPTCGKKENALCRRRTRGKRIVPSPGMRLGGFYFHTAFANGRPAIFVSSPPVRWCMGGGGNRPRYRASLPDAARNPQVRRAFEHKPRNVTEKRNPTWWSGVRDFDWKQIRMRRGETSDVRIPRNLTMENSQAKIPEIFPIPEIYWEYYHLFKLYSY